MKNTKLSEKEEMQLWFDDLSHEEAVNLSIEFHGVDSCGNLTDEQIMEIYRYNTNSKIGCYHWFGTLIARVLHNCEYIANNPQNERVQSLAKKAQETVQFIIKHRRKINSEESLEVAIKVIKEALEKVEK